MIDASSRSNTPVESPSESSSSESSSSELSSSELSSSELSSSESLSSSSSARSHRALWCLDHGNYKTLGLTCHYACLAIKCHQTVSVPLTFSLKLAAGFSSTSTSLDFLEEMRTGKMLATFAARN